jgi:hypothetical protein
MSKKVVARYQDGRVVKGTSLDVDPNRTRFHVRAADAAAVQVDMNDLKALFFVRSLEGDATRNDRATSVDNDPRGRGATLVKLGFADGETIVGMTIGWPPRKPFFFVTPVDPDSNNIRILVNRSAVTEMEQSA